MVTDAATSPKARKHGNYFQEWANCDRSHSKTYFYSIEALRKPRNATARTRSLINIDYINNDIRLALNDSLSLWVGLARHVANSNSQSQCTARGKI